MKKLFQKVAFFVLVIGLGVFTMPCKTAEAKPEDSFVQVLFENTSETLMVSGSGSGAVVKKEKAGSYILTAAHVCLSGIFEYRSPTPYDLLFIEISVVDRDFNIYPAAVYGFDIKYDLCLLFVEDIDKPALKIAKKPPKGKDEAVNIAAPLGLFGEDLVPYFKGHYLGTRYDSWIDVMESGAMAVYSLPAAGGSSGSPVLNKYGRLIGMIHSVYPAFHHISLSPTWKQIDSFLKRQLGDL